MKAFEEWYKTFDSAGYTWEGFVEADLEAAYIAGMLRAAEICEARFESIEGSAEGYEYGCAMEIRKEAEK